MKIQLTVATITRGLQITSKVTFQELKCRRILWVYRGPPKAKMSAIRYLSLPYFYFYKQFLEKAKSVARDDPGCHPISDDYEDEVLLTQGGFYRTTTSKGANDRNDYSFRPYFYSRIVLLAK